MSPVRRRVETLLARSDVWILATDSLVLQIVAGDLPLPPFGLRAARGALRGRRPGPELILGTGRLGCGDLVIDLEAAEVLETRPDWEALRRRRAARARRNRADSRLPADVHPWLEAPFERLAEALEEGDDAGTLVAVRRLAGRGPGLTPAGDDVVLGAILGLWARSPGGSERATRWAAEAIPRTTRLSGAWLEAAARGEVGEVWGRFLDALGRSAAVEATAREELLGWGATSGACGLAGFEAVTFGG